MSRRIASVTMAVLLSTAFLAAPVAATASVDRIGGFGSVLAVARPPDFPVGSLMRVDCQLLVRVEAPDGSATETMVCALSDEPVMIPAFQGAAPDSAFIDVGGPCIWSSDYWWNVAGSEVYASSFRVVVTPSGKVHARSTYPAQPLDCG